MCENRSFERLLKPVVVYLQCMLRDSHCYFSVMRVKSGGTVPPLQKVGGVPPYPPPPESYAYGRPISPTSGLRPRVGESNRTNRFESIFWRESNRNYFGECSIFQLQFVVTSFISASQHVACIMFRKMAPLSVFIKSVMCVFNLNHGLEWD